MLKWKEDINGYNGGLRGYIGFEGVNPLYRVGQDEYGWFYENLAAAYGFDGYESAEEAKAAAEADYKADMDAILQMFIEEEDPLTCEDLEDIHWDEVAHERMEIMKGLW